MDTVVSVCELQHLVYVSHYWQDTTTLVPVDVTPINTLYVFVDIGIDTQHFIDTIKRNFEPGKKLVVVGTIQFVTALQVRPNLRIGADLRCMAHREANC